FSTLPVEAFGTRQYRDIYREIMRQALSKNVIDPVLIGEALGGEYQAIMSASVKLSWAIANLEQYASLVVKNHFIRSAEGVVADAIAALDSARTGDESMTAIAELRDSLQHMELNSGELVAVHINDLLAGVETRLEERMAGVGEGRTLLTGIDELDALTGGFDLTDLVLIAARPSVGKTEFALNLIDKITELGGGVLLFSMEMSGIQIAERQVAGAGGLSTSKLKSPGQLEDEDWARISAGIGRMVNRPIWIIDASELTVEQIKQSAIAHKRKHPELAAVFVDYLGLISVN
ncbi:TPA: replicative DNA helicase, partial [Yersinia enterocolitica]